MGDLGGLALAAGSVVAADQALKVLLLGRAGAEGIHIASHVRIRAVRGPLTIARRLGVPRAVLALLWGALAVAVLAGSSLDPSIVPGQVAVALAVALGGAAGNVLDELARGSVVDYVDLGFWPAFNLADVAIVGGVLAACAAFLTRAFG